jgi:methylmalonyl-CoA/ethylmalonyl-CoA epimerase
MRYSVLALSALFVLSGRAAQLPDYYSSVHAIVWVVADLEHAVQGWTKLGFPGIENLGTVEVPAGPRAGLRPQPQRIGLAKGRIGETAVFWIHPMGNGDAYSEFLKKHGSGIFSLVHRAPSLEALEAEVVRLQAAGAGILGRGSVRDGAGEVRYVFFDTEEGGKFVLGLVAGDLENSPLAIPPPPSSTPRITQFAFAVKDMAPVSAYWAKLGFPEFSYTHPQISELRYRDQPGDFDMRLGWQRHGKIPYEWTQSLKGPNVYLDHIERHGEGIHHIAFNVADMDAEVARWQKLGFPYSMGGAWGDKGKPGSGRFVYVNTQAIGGTDVELLWNYR